MTRPSSVAQSLRSLWTFNPISFAEQDRYTPDETERMLFVLPNMVEALVHGVAHQSRAVLSRKAAKDEAIRTVLVYLNSCQGGHPTPY